MLDIVFWPPLIHGRTPHTHTHVCTQWYMPVITALRNQRQGDLREFKTTLVYDQSYVVRLYLNNMANTDRHITQPRQDLPIILDPSLTCRLMSRERSSLSKPKFGLQMTTFPTFLHCSYSLSAEVREESLWRCRVLLLGTPSLVPLPDMSYRFSRLQIYLSIEKRAC